jgi:DNA primase
MGFPQNLCFAGETRFLTPEGLRRLDEMAGRSTQVLTTGGVWTEAPIKRFGVQLLLALRLKRQGQEKIMYTTADHRWVAYTGSRSTQRQELLTSQLMPGTRLVCLFENGLSRVRPSAFGIAHGIVFGDGTRQEARQSPATITLCGEKMSALLGYFPLSPTKEVPGVGIRVADLPRSFKERPELTESKSYLYGWLAGYFAADGKVGTDGSVEIFSSSYQNLAFVRKACGKLGIGTMPICSYERTGEGAEPTPLYSMRLMRPTLTPAFFLLPAQRERAKTHGFEQAQRPACWTVVSVEPTDRVEEVYCAVVPETHCFVLEDNILTGNCGGRCIKKARARMAPLALSFRLGALRR